MRVRAGPVPLKRWATAATSFGLAAVSICRSVVTLVAALAVAEGQLITEARNETRSNIDQSGIASPAGSGAEMRFTGGMRPHARKPTPLGSSRKRSDGFAPLSGVRYEKRPVTPWRYGSLPVASEAHRAFGLVVVNGSSLVKYERFRACSRNGTVPSPASVTIQSYGRLRIAMTITGRSPATVPMLATTASRFSVWYESRRS